MSKVVELNEKVSNNIISVALQSEAVKLILQTLVDHQELEGDYTLIGSFKLVPVINK